VTSLRYFPPAHHLPRADVFLPRFFPVPPGGLTARVQAAYRWIGHYANPGRSHPGLHARLLTSFRGRPFNRLEGGNLRGRVHFDEAWMDRSSRRHQVFKGARSFLSPPRGQNRRRFRGGTRGPFLPDVLG